MHMGRIQRGGLLLSILMATPALGGDPALAGGLQPGPVGARGANAGGVLMFHGAQEMQNDTIGPCTAFPLPEICAQLDPTAYTNGEGEYWILVVASFNPAGPMPEIRRLSFGITSLAPSAVITCWGPCSPQLSPVEFPTAGWPAPGEGVSITWAPNCLQGSSLLPVYYFIVQTYSPGLLALGPHPSDPPVFWDCGQPPQLDPIMGYGIAGLGGITGVNPLCMNPGSAPEPLPPNLTMRPALIGAPPFQIGFQGAGIPAGVEYRIYDAGGRQIRMLEPPEGRGPVEWDGRSASGSPVSSGLYMLTARSAGEVLGRSRIVLIH